MKDGFGTGRVELRRLTKCRISIGTEFAWKKAGKKIHKWKRRGSHDDFSKKCKKNPKGCTDGLQMS